MVVEVDADDGTGAKFVGPPFKLDGHAGPTRRAAPHMAADAQHVLRDVLGFDADAIARLVQSGAV